MKISITNIVALNGGDAAILMGMIKALKNRYGENTEFVVFSSKPEVCKKLYPDLNWRETIGLSIDRTPYNHIRYFGKLVRLSKRARYYTAACLVKKGFNFGYKLIDKYDRESLYHYKTSTLIISAGGTYLIEPYGITTQYIDYKISLLLGKPLIFYTQSLGPFYLPQTLKRLDFVFTRSKLILLRDEQSRTNLQVLKSYDRFNIRVVPDAAFALLEEKDLTPFKDLQSLGKIAISVRSWGHFGKDQDLKMFNYRDSIAKLIEHLIDLGYKIEFVSTCQGLKDYTNDNNEASKILNLVSETYRHNITIYNQHLSLSQVVKHIKDADILIGTRLHMCILSLISHKPVFPIAYEFKTEELFQYLGYDNVIKMENINSTDLISSFDSFLSYYTPDRHLSIQKNIFELSQKSLKVPNYIK